jgi:6-phosphogluconolactonase
VKKNFELIHCGSDLELARAVAERWLARAQAHDGCVALSGGRIARTFFEAVVERANPRSKALRQVHYFWADERCVPPDDPESNYRLAKIHLLDPLGVETGRIHRLRGELDPVEGAGQGETELRHWANATAGSQPRLDLVFLGMGEDGHTASLFPNASEVVVHSSATYCSVVGPKPPPRRLTLSYAALAAAREVWVLVSGKGKKQALKASLLEDAAAPTPLGRVLQLRDKTLVFSDVGLDHAL